MQDLVTIKIFNMQNDLYIAKTFLESEGIECFLKDELINQVSPFYTNALNGTKLQVRSDQAEEGIRLLIEGGFAKEEDYEIPEGIKKTGKAVEWIKNLFK